MEYNTEFLSSYTRAIVCEGAIAGASKGDEEWRGLDGCSVVFVEWCSSTCWVVVGVFVEQSGANCLVFTGISWSLSILLDNQHHCYWFNRLGM